MFILLVNKLDNFIEILKSIPKEERRIVFTKSHEINQMLFSKEKIIEFEDFNTINYYMQNIEFDNLVIVTDDSEYKNTNYTYYISDNTFDKINNIFFINKSNKELSNIVLPIENNIDTWFSELKKSFSIPIQIEKKEENTLHDKFDFILINNNSTSIKEELKNFIEIKASKNILLKKLLNINFKKVFICIIDTSYSLSLKACLLKLEDIKHYSNIDFFPLMISSSSRKIVYSPKETTQSFVQSV